ncbi:DUF882 domain-containing protein [Bosea sp. TWI1241]|jgi:uncharacterized protein YcbK (DUF882 family)|uniref:DUF882 domain-containing protein n=1 Tax=Bosea sp. TWI1241 TaxID=3148904 RepID=UPI00320BA84A
MRHVASVAVIAAFWSTASLANLPLEKIAFQPQVKGLACLKPETLAMLKELIERIGPIQITSTCGGRHARNSLHYSGKAVDFRPLGTSPRKAAAVARSMASIGGVGAYSNGLVHVDVGERQANWYGHKRSRRVAYARR